ncbi:hypothetical protein [Pontibacter sp. 172403-2]|uniref:hypothetical protein n=1 Tax=Pontibacter rufus TaxID=2791028 RepID=UPI001E6086CE|nr:hypothetical protein [Pontibacter sp. 172403-2]
MLIGFFAIAVLLPVVRYALRRLSPARQLTVLDASELKYIQRQEWKLTVAYFFFAAVLSVFAAGVLAMLSSILYASGQRDIYVLTPNFQALFAPGLLLGLTLAVLPLRAAQSSLLGHDYNLYQTYMQQQEGHNSSRSYRILFLVMLVIAALGAWYAMRWHVTITKQEISVSSFLQQDHTYSMQDISSIQSLGREGAYLISFNDARIINTAYLKPVQPETIALLSQYSGKRVIH